MSSINVVILIENNQNAGERIKRLRKGRPKLMWTNNQNCALSIVIAGIVSTVHYPSLQVFSFY